MGRRQGTLWGYREPGWLFAYSDLNRDFVYQSGEPYGWYAGGQSINPSNLDDMEINISIFPTGTNMVPPPAVLVGRNEVNITQMQDVHIGTVATLNDERFSLELAEKALWEPFSAIESGQAGIFFLEPYNPNKIPVLFIHGINGSPIRLKLLIESIDSERFQPWVLQYPPGLRLTTISLGLHQMMEILKHQYSFDKAHVVAYSMGGLIGRGYVGHCIELNGCDYLQSFTTISSPLGGMKSADLGIEYAPMVVPVWNDLSPESEFIAGLFDLALPDSMPYSLLFTFRNEKLLSSGSSDGVVALNSQLRQAAQDQADFIYGLDETHVGVPENPHLFELVNTILDRASAY